ncbi:MAG TPA: bi-domain-containing oxidoreductase [Bacteroidota bacterium]
MLQAIAKKGKVIAVNVPAPVVSKGSVLIKVVNSCISAGTELTTVQSSGVGVAARALKQADVMRKVMTFVRTQGIGKTIKRIRGVLEDGSPIGYSVAGVVVSVGEGVKGFSKGDPVAAAGAGFANHAEYVDVPANLVCRLPRGLGYADASTVTLGAIALQGVRRADLRLGEFCAVIGTGILGLLTVQMLRLSGVRVLAIDIDSKRLALARELGAEAVLNSASRDPVAEVMTLTGGHGVDAVLFTAATTSSEPLSQAFRMCKRKGRVVLVGVSGMEIRREDMYAKELDFLISTSYGPGRYDRTYEEQGHDYPYGYVRWTENRNMTEYLRLVAEGKIRLDKLVNSVYPISNVEQAYKALTKPPKPIMVVLDYGPPGASVKSDELHVARFTPRKADGAKIGVALVGAGSFATGVHLPNLGRLGKYFELRAVVNRTGHKAASVAKRHNAPLATTDYNEVLKDSDVDLVLICTRHDSHADLALQALQAGKNVFVEKPLAVDEAGLDAITRFYKKFRGDNPPLLMVGFNRRFSPYAAEIKRWTDKRVNPLLLHYRMNAGFIPLDHWVHEAGGRIVGEACHIIDLMTFFTGSKIESVETDSVRLTGDRFSSADNKVIKLKYADGSVATIEYFAIGSSELPKELLEVHFDQKTIVMDDYRSLKGYGVAVKDLRSSLSQKGHYEELVALAEALKGERGKWPIELWEMVDVTRASIMAK